MKTFELSLGIILIVACHALGFWWSFRDEEWPFQIRLFRDPIGTVKVIVLGLAMLFGGGFMIWSHRWWTSATIPASDHQRMWTV